jgi:site-specific recombinase XerD
MKIEEAITLFGYHQRSNQKTRTIQSYRPLLQKIRDQFAGRSFDSIGPDEIYRFLEAMTESRAKSTRRLRFAQFKAFYNFLIEKADLNMRNPLMPRFWPRPLGHLSRWPGESSIERRWKN